MFYQKNYFFRKSSTKINYKGITEYIIYRKEQNNNKKVGIKLIDTPGLAKIEEKGKDMIDTIQIFKDNILKKNKRM